MKMRFTKADFVFNTSHVKYYFALQTSKVKRWGIYRLCMGYLWGMHGISIGLPRPKITIQVIH